MPPKPARSPPAPHRETAFVHAGAAPDPGTGSVVPAIHLATTFAQGEPGVHKGFEYSRTGNPTRARLEEALAAADAGEAALAFSSGMGAIVTLAHTLRSGARVVVEEECYGGTRRFFTRNLAEFGVKAVYADLTDPESAKRAITQGTALVVAETPTNPRLKVADVKLLADLSRDAGATLAVDATFATPHLVRPLEQGADAVIHSATKYLGGHSDVVSGAIVFRERGALHDKVRFNQNSLGAVPSPFDCFLVMRGLRTLHVRMERHCANAARVAQWLGSAPGVASVFYPGLPSHPTHAVAKRTMDGFGGMVSFELSGGLEAAKHLFRSLRVFTPAESLGAVESLINHPAIMTHASVPPEERRRLGITDGLVRLSVGLEHVDDLIADLEQALGQAR